VTGVTAWRSVGRIARGFRLRHGDPSGHASYFGAVLRNREWILNIRTKVVLLLTGVFLVFALIEWGVGEMLLLPRFEQIERDYAATAMKRIDSGVSQALDGLQVSAIDWGNWADTYRYMQDHNNEYSQENLNALALKQLHISALAFIDLNGRIIWSLAQDPGTAAPIQLDLFTGGAMPADFPWAEDLREASPRHGLIATNPGVLLAAVSPILDGYGHGPSRGLVVMGRLLTSLEIAAIGSKAQTSVTLTAMQSAAHPRLNFLPNPAAPGETTQTVPTSETTQVYRVFQDIYGQPIMTLRVDVPRTLTAHARTTVNSAMAFTIGAFVVVLVFVLLVLERTVFAPLATVTRHTMAIGAGDDLTTRLNLDRSDEIGTLANEFDRMVAQVAESRRQLVDNSFQAGMAEFSRGVLHNIGNAMTPLSVRVAKLQDLLRTAPIEDIERALAECAEGEIPSQRQSDLDEFLRLASAEMAGLIKTADADVGMMMRQATMVQNALSERLPALNARTVIEAVELPAVIHQSLEIVPDSCREQIDIEIDRSLQLVSPVWTARTVLRLVIQNLIINAAEATRAAGKSRGSVRFTAAMQYEGGEQKLQLECHDTGIGIEPHNVERIFERGFSTKLGKGNSGIGLHWCATAINALGGRIWATSEGIGHGASLHIVIPVTPPAEAAGTIAA
jgi:two-component system, NtrC family, sensor kinase